MLKINVRESVPDLGRKEIPHDNEANEDNPAGPPSQGYSTAFSGHWERIHVDLAIFSTWNCVFTTAGFSEIVKVINGERWRCSSLGLASLESPDPLLAASVVKLRRPPLQTDASPRGLYQFEVRALSALVGIRLVT